MQKEHLLAIIISLVLVSVALEVYTDLSLNLTGNVAQTQEQRIGPSQEEQTCMMNCMKCTSPGINCTGDQTTCQTQCNTQKPKATEETSCMEKCVLVGCGEFDFSCQTTNKDKCEKECNLIKEPEAKSAEEQCMRDCVKKVDPELICQAGKGGEKGNEICQKCAADCVHLYAGPCLSEEKLEQKKKTCKTCEHCYGSPVMGDSGEGYECIVEIECKDATSEFGDNPGSGEGIIAKTGDAIGNTFERIGDFFSNLFGNEKETEEPAQKEDTKLETQEEVTETPAEN